MSGMAIEFRRATRADLNDLIDLALSDMPERPDAASDATGVQCDRLDRQDRREIEFVVAEHKGKLVGQLVLRWPGQPDRRAFADIEELRVLPSYRGQGVGTEMMAYVEWVCMRERIDQIGVALDPATHSDLMAWFERMDYVRTGEPYAVDDPGPCDHRDAPRVRRDAGGAPQVVRVDMVKEL